MRTRRRRIVRPPQHHPHHHHHQHHHHHLRHDGSEESASTSSGSSIAGSIAGSISSTSSSSSSTSPKRRKTVVSNRVTCMKPNVPPSCSTTTTSTSSSSLPSPSSSSSKSADSSILYEVEDVVDVKCEKGIYYFLIKWKGYGSDQNTWEPEHHLEKDRSSDHDEDARPVDDHEVHEVHDVNNHDHDNEQMDQCDHDVIDDDKAPSIADLVLTDSLIPGKIVQLTHTTDPTDTTSKRKKIALIKWCNHPALTWIDYEYVRHKYPDIVLDYYEAMVVFDSFN